MSISRPVLLLVAADGVLCSGCPRSLLMGGMRVSASGTAAGVFSPSSCSASPCRRVARSVTAAFSADGEKKLPTCIGSSSGAAAALAPSHSSRGRVGVDAVASRGLAWTWTSGPAAAASCVFVCACAGFAPLASRSGRDLLSDLRVCWEPRVNSAVGGGELEPRVPVTVSCRCPREFFLAAANSLRRRRLVAHSHVSRNWGELIVL